jgi:hypothetical protein
MLSIARPDNCRPAHGLTCQDELGLIARDRLAIRQLGESHAAR